jgi:hypothetical protein
MMQRDGPETKRCRRRTHTKRLIIGEKTMNEMEEKKIPAPRRGVSLFFLEFVVSNVLCR